MSILQDKVVLVTGAGAGIGRATALAMAEAGANVAAADIDLAAAQRTADQAALRAESEALLERVINEFGGIPLAPKWAKVKPDGRTLADSARSKLEAMRSLAVGRVAPEIERQDIDGKPMKLSEYRGKVVVLCFWGTWCGPCMAMVPLEKALVERLKGRPFALLGINSDSRTR